ncbi:MAG: sialate O-acetylesterase, partial [Gammaproteobacteria bacterium]|nr:sialate O-acetylesterase [Gammaproteobacteria bacterium]
YSQERSEWREKNKSAEKLPFLLMHRTSLDFKPVGLYNAMIAPLVNMKFSGVIWYQGESNTHNPQNYSDQFSILINLWRTLFNQPQLPFLFVQLANFQMPDDIPAESSWAEIRAAQTQVLNSVENTAMALAIDVGERHNIHPLDKKTVGERLALGARHLVYGEKQLNYTSPLIDTALLTNSHVIINFKHINKGLMVKGEKLLGFAIAGEDKKFIWAKAKLENNQVTVWHDSIKSPKYVRYAWANNPEKANLFNDQGLPVTPFSYKLQ